MNENEQNAKREIAQMFDRFAVGNKFNLIEDGKISLNNTDDSKTTFMDELIKQFKEGCDLVLKKYLFEEAFDSDSVEIDIGYYSNIDTLLQNEDAVEHIHSFVENVNSQKNTFSIGYSFYYWHWYENNEERDYVHVDIKIYDLCVPKKFNDFKAEIFEYDNITKEQYECTFIKALELEKTKKVKIIVTEYGNDHYDIEENAIIGLWHLIAVILYTDFSAHCSQFSASFRRLTPFETLDVTKKRNANFYWMARRLGEAVEVFGLDSSGGLKGPFYSGINRRMVIPEFNLRLNAPTSTTKQIAVALNFAGSDGTILQMNNDGNGDMNPLKAFDVSYLSRFPSEDERLFIGGYSRIRVETIRLTMTQKNFINFIEPLYYFDAMITGAEHFKHLDVDKKGCRIIKQLIDYKMGKQTNQSMDPYVYETFDAFCANKKEIKINFGYLSEAKDFMRDLILHSFENIDDSEDLNEDFDETNLVRPILAEIFPNVISLEITSTAFNNSFSLLAFLDILQASKWQKVTIEGLWLYKLWQTSKRALIEQTYESKQYELEYIGYGKLIIRKVSKINFKSFQFAVVASVDQSSESDSGLWTAMI